MLCIFGGSGVEPQLAAADATNTALQAQWQQANAENSMHQQRLDDARRDFAAELDKLRAAAKLADERFRAAETRALLEVDRERGTAAKLQKELDAARGAASQAGERHRAELAALQEQFGDLRQKAGVLEGNLQAVNASREVAVNDIKALQVQLAEAVAKLSTARAEADSWCRKAAQAEQLITELRAAAKPARPARKAKVE